MSSERLMDVQFAQGVMFMSCVSRLWIVWRNNPLDSLGLYAKYFEKLKSLNLSFSCIRGKKNFLRVLIGDPLLLDC